MFTLIGAVLWILAMVCTWYMSGQQNRSQLLWCLGGLVVSPFASTIALAVLKIWKK